MSFKFESILVCFCFFLSIRYIYRRVYKTGNQIGGEFADPSQTVCAGTATLVTEWLLFIVIIIIIIEESHKL